MRSTQDDRIRINQSPSIQLATVPSCWSLQINSDYSFVVHAGDEMHKLEAREPIGVMFLRQVFVMP